MQLSKEFWVDLAAGWVAGGASVLAVQPVDTVLTRLQSMPAAQANLLYAADLAGATAGYNGVSVAKKVWSEGGVRAFWRGTAPMTLVVPVQNALLFAGYGVGERWGRSLQKDGGSSPLLPVFVGGCAGGILQSFAVAPTELLKIRQQKVGGSMGVEASNIKKVVGTPALWRGLNATLLRDGIPHGVWEMEGDSWVCLLPALRWFVGYEWSKQQLISQEGLAPQADLPARVPLTAGAFAAAVAWGVGYPADTIKTRIQTAAVMTGATPSVGATCRAMLAETGGSFVRAFYRGFYLKLARALPASAVSFYVYEEVAQRINKLT